jgi:hypothetical protein
MLPAYSIDRKSVWYYFRKDNTLNPLIRPLLVFYSLYSIFVKAKMDLFLVSDWGSVGPPGRMRPYIPPGCPIDVASPGFDLYGGYIVLNEAIAMKALHV